MQKLQLSIPEPCQENWQNMTPTQQGRFCKTCAKEVIDFSTMTDMQVLHYFSNMTHEKVCGRALPEQLDRTISRPEPPKRKLFRYWNYIAMFFMFFVKGNNAAAQNNAKPPTELSPVNNCDIRGQIAVKQESRMVTGKITDKDGNPVSYASVKVKGTSTGIYADANGAYLIRVNSNAILIITAAALKAVEVATGTGSVFNMVMERETKRMREKKITLVFGVMSQRNTDEYYGSPDKPKRVAVIQVKDEATGKVIPQASLQLQKQYSKKADTVVTDKKGEYKLKGIAADENYTIKVAAAGFEPAAFSVQEYEFNDRKKEWEVLLRKEKIMNTRSTTVAKPGKKTRVMLGGISNVNLTRIPLYVVDGVVQSNKTDIDPGDVEDISVLQGPAAVALFGPDAANGAILITTRKSKEMQLKDVTVTAGFTTRSSMRGGMMITVKGDGLNEKIVTFKTLLTDSIKVFPNPVQANSDFSIRLKLKQPGSHYSMLITDAVGKVLLQQKISTAAKEHTEKIAGDSRWSAGLYYIRIFDTQNNLVSKSSFIYR